jgi:hypothetical protein
MSNEVSNMMLEDSKDLLDNVEITTIAVECQKLKNIEDEIERTEELLKNLKTMADDIGSRVIPELLAEQGLSSIKLADGLQLQLKENIGALFQKKKTEERQPINGFVIKV